MGIYFLISSVATLVGSACVLIPSLIKASRTSTQQVSKTYLWSKFLQLTLQGNYCLCLYLDQETRDASYVLALGLGAQTVTLALLANHRRRIGYEELP